MSFLFFCLCQLHIFFLPEHLLTAYLSLCIYVSMHLEPNKLVRDAREGCGSTSNVAPAVISGGTVRDKTDSVLRSTELLWS